MARMFPANIEGNEKATEGVTEVFRFLEEAARPHGDFICWYEPAIGKSGKNPDFVLFGKRLGLLVLEVRDWTRREIISYSPQQFTLRISGRTTKRPNPDKQIKGHVHALKERLRGIPELLGGENYREGRPIIPIGRMIVFPKIGKEDYLDGGLRWLIPLDRVLLLDDLDPAGEILSDPTGKRFHDRVSPAIPFSFKGLSHKAFGKLVFHIWPESLFEVPAREGSGKARFQREVQALDAEQARLALRLGPGHHVIKGPPGSGKTLVLVHRGCHLYKYNPKMRRILLVCFNIALVSYLKRMIQDRGLGVGKDGIHVFHFFELCSEVLGETVRYENEEREYYDGVIREAMEKISGGKSRLEPFDAVLVDEGQDFNEEMMKIILGVLKPQGDLIITLDSYQDLYGRGLRWKSLGVRAGGRTRYLRKVYRNTTEIFEFTQRFIGEKPAAEKQLALLPDDFAFRGERPELLDFASQEEIEDFLVRDIRKGVERGEYRRSEIAIIYDDKIYRPERFDYDNRALPMRILEKLAVSGGVPATWVSQDVRAKETFDTTSDRVSLISIHSSKGLDFDLVYLIGIDRIQPTEGNRQNLLSLIYVAMTRAKFRLVIPYVEATEFIRQMKNCLSMKGDSGG